MKTVWLGSDLFVDCFRAAFRKTEITALYTIRSDDPYEQSLEIASAARENGVPVFYMPVTEETLRTQYENGVGLVFSADYPIFLPETDGLRFASLHAAPLPEGRSIRPAPFAVLSGAKSWGVTLCDGRVGFGAGDILFQKRFPMTKRDTADSLLLKCAYAARFIVNSFFDSPDTAFANARPQQTTGKFLPFSEKLFTLSSESTAEELDLVRRAAGKYGAHFIP